MENIIAQLQQLITDYNRLKEENLRLRQAIIVHNVEVGPVKFLSDEDLEEVDFYNVIFRYGDTITLGHRNSPMSRKSVTTWEQIKKEND